MNQFAQQHLERRARLGFRPIQRRAVVIPPPPPEPIKPVVIVRPAGWCPHWRQIVEEVARKHELRASDLLGPRKTNRIVAARNEAFYRLRHEITVLDKPMSYPEIGRRFSKDHATVLHGVRAHAEVMRQERVAQFLGASS